MYFPDLTPYSYHRPEEEPDTVNIGWLQRDFPFPKGDVSSEFLDRLFAICRDKWFKMHRGFHGCEFCSTAPDGPPLVKRNNSEARLGYAEIRVRHPNGKVFGSPSLIYHYVSDHQYCPPQEFIEAVLLGESLGRLAQT
jgi:hypothetical protein